MEIGSSRYDSVVLPDPELGSGEILEMMPEKEKDRGKVIEKCV